MIALILQNFRHLWRTRLLQFALVFCFAVQFAVLKFAREIKLDFMGQTYFQTKLTGLDLLFTALFVQLFIGYFFAMMFGLWTAPYLHQGERAGLTYTLPVPRWKYVVAYLTVMVGVLFLLYLEVWLIHLSIVGKTPGFWPLFWRGAFWETVAFSVLMLGFAAGALWVGSLASALIGNAVLFLMQVAAFFIRPTLIPFVFGEAWGNWIIRLYKLLPPFGEITFDLWHIYRAEPVDTTRLVSWGLWGGLFFGLFVLRLRFPITGLFAGVRSKD